MQTFLENFLNLDSFYQIYPLLLQGLGYSCILAIVALPLALLAGLSLAIVYSFQHRIVNAIVMIYIDIIRSFPVVVLLVLIFYGLPFLGLKLDGFSAAVLAIVLNNSGYFGEIFRAGVVSVGRGQREAALALGLKPIHVALYIILPQAVRKVFAPLASNSLELVKTTSIAALVSLPELLRSARVAQEQTYNPTPLMAAAIIFFVILWPFARWTAHLERRALKVR